VKVKNLKSIYWHEFTDKIKTGDIAGVVEPGLVCKLSEKLIQPASPYLHFFLIGDYVPDENDFVILESIPSHGVAVGRLSWYLPKTVAIFRPNPFKLQELLPGVDPEKVGRQAVLQATKFGRSKYDFRICFFIGWRTLTGCLRNWARGRGLGVHYTEFPPSRDRRVICTEAVDEGYRNLYPVFDRNYAVLPANLMAQHHDGYLDLICRWEKD